MFQEFSIFWTDLRRVVPSFIRRLEYAFSAVEDSRKSRGPPWQIGEQGVSQDDVELNLNQRTAPDRRFKEATVP